MTGRLHLVGPQPFEPAQGVAPAGLLDGWVVYPAAGSGQRIVGPSPEDLDDHLARLGPRPTARGHHGDALVEALAAVELTGRGGGHFPAAAKWRSVLAAGGGGTVVANAAEGEPASAKDAALLQHRPHLVLDGLLSAAEAMGADDVVVWLHEGAHASRSALNRALAERRTAFPTEPQIRVIGAPDRYISGESSVIVRALSGGPALPTLRRRPAAQEGVGGRPTLVHNVETLARVGLVARTGLEYRPTTLLTVLAGGHRTVLEVGPEVTLGQAVAAGGWRPAEPPSAVLLGGYGGAWMDWTRAAPLAVDERAVRAAGSSLGAGIVIPLPATACGLAETAAITRYLADSSARQCGPCLFGLPAIADVLDLVVEGSAGRSELKLLERYVGEVSGRGACHHPDGAVRLVRSALDVFRIELAEHLRGRPCAAAAPSVGLPGVG
jgi:NADH:ubiquinone oxidoreductase subunit F (NADH-binding)